MTETKTKYKKNCLHIFYAQTLLIFHKELVVKVLFCSCVLGRVSKSIEFLGEFNSTRKSSATNEHYLFS